MWLLSEHRPYQRVRVRTDHAVVDVCEQFGFVFREVVGPLLLILDSMNVGRSYCLFVLIDVNFSGQGFHCEIL